MKKRTFYSILVSAFLFIGVGAHITEDPDSWEIPERFKNMNNPVEMNTQSIRIGSSLFRRNCRDCHGAQGKGDGPEAADLKSKLRAFDSEEVQNLTDGELFYKTSEGRDEMPGFKADLIEEDIWHIVNFIRTLEK